MYVPTTHQAADLLTKHLPFKQFVFLRDMVMGGEELQNHFFPPLTVSYLNGGGGVFGPSSPVDVETPDPDPVLKDGFSPG